MAGPAYPGQRRPRDVITSVWCTARRILPPLPLGVAMIKGGIAITLAMILIFSRLFDQNAVEFPIALNSMILVVIIGSAGKTVGGCIDTLLLGGSGLALGVVCFIVLAALGAAKSTVGQGFVFAAFVYLMALVRYNGARYIPFYLLAVLFAFQGTYVTLQDDPARRMKWLLAYFQAYAWAFAIVLATNLICWPVSSERELRELLVTSLQHVSTLAHLTCKTYAREIGTEEKDVRDLLIQTIRNDFSSLTARLEEASFEILYTRWTMTSYRHVISKVRGLQQALITSSSALDMMDELDPNGVNVKRLLFDQAETASTFGDFRHGIDIVIAEIIDILSDRPPATDAALSPTGTNKHAPIDLETAIPPVNPTAVQPQFSTVSRSLSAVSAAKIADLSARLQFEVGRSELRHNKIRLQGSHPASRAPSRPVSVLGENLRDEDDVETREEEEANGGGRARSRSRSRSRPRGGPAGSSTAGKSPEKQEVDSAGVAYFKKAWETFADRQANAIFGLIESESAMVGDQLRISEGMPSLVSMYAERLPKAWSSTLMTKAPHGALQQRGSGSRDGSDISEQSEQTTVEPANVIDEEVPCSEALTKSYSLLFGFGQLTEELSALHSLVVEPRSKRIRFHIFDRPKFLRWGKTKDHDDLSLQEALAMLNGVKYRGEKGKKVHFSHRVLALERWFRSDRSLYAFKVALGATVYSSLLFAPVPRKFFIRYGMTSSLITVIVAIAPSLGQTLTTFLLQLFGTGIGLIYGLIMLEIFHNVGGYIYNPYGLAASMFCWGVATSYYFYKDPRFYTGALLALNGAGTVMCQEWLYNELPELKQPYASPGLRVVAAIFQIFVFRTPARHQLRLSIAGVTEGLSSYNSLLQAHINTVAPPDEIPSPPPEALAKVQRELIKRETRLQAQIIALGPLFAFAKMEPQFGNPFKGKVLSKIIRSQQIILDRLREARTAVGTQGFNKTVHRDFACILFPYRLHSQRLSRTLFYLNASSLRSKTPLPRDVPSSKPTWASFEHDALVLTRRLSRVEGGEEKLREDGFLRYWFYLVAVGAVSTELEELEKYLGELFGLPEIWLV